MWFQTDMELVVGGGGGVRSDRGRKEPRGAPVKRLGGSSFF